jgi:HAD superfamily hydrolase (TIGR01509 family)
MSAVVGDTPVRAREAFPFDAVLFDCDGTLVESEPISFRVLSEMLGAEGWPITADEFSEIFLGQSVKSRMDVIRSKTAIPDMDAWYLAYTDRRDKALSNEVAAIPFAMDVVRCLAQRQAVRLAVVSASSRAKMELQLDKVGLRGWFGHHLYSGQQVARNKPWPDVYLEAASSLGVEIARCAVIEDSVSGLTAGVAAGATVYAYSPPHRGPESTRALIEAGAKAVFDNMRSLGRLFAGDYVTLAEAGHLLIPVADAVALHERIRAGFASDTRGFCNKQ